MATVLISGGAGFLGSHLCDYYVEKGDFVLCVDNLLTGSLENISHLFSKPNFRFYHYDITHYFFVEEEIDLILHFASPASPRDYLTYPLETMQVGAQGTWNLLQLARQKKAVFLLASTSEVYGDPLEHPQREEYFGNVNPVGKRGVYDEAKRFAEALTMAFHRKYGIPTRIVRIFNTYGPRMRLDDGRVIPNFISQALQGKPLTVYGDGSQTRSFCYVSDLVEGITKLAEVEYPHPLNLGNPEEISILDFAKEIIELCESSSTIQFQPLPEGDPKLRRPDISKAREILQWCPKVNRKEGLLKTIQYFREKLGL